MPTLTNDKPWPPAMVGCTVRERDKRFPHREGKVIGWRVKPPQVQVEWNTGRITWLSAKNLHRYYVTNDTLPERNE